jgi:hypothetical protein
LGHGNRSPALSGDMLNFAPQYGHLNLSFGCMFIAFGGASFIVSHAIDGDVSHSRIRMFEQFRISSKKSPTVRIDLS